MKSNVEYGNGTKTDELRARARMYDRLQWTACKTEDEMVAAVRAHWRRMRSHERDCHLVTHRVTFDCWHPAPLGTGHVWGVARDGNLRPCSLWSKRLVMSASTSRPAKTSAKSSKKAKTAKARTA